MQEDKSSMTAPVVIGIIQVFNQNGIEVIIDGGWAVDALLGEQTREHEDLDLAVFHQDVLKIRELFEAGGFQEIPQGDSWECNFVLGNDQGHLIDIHSCTFDKEGNHIFGVEYPYESLQGSGEINGFPVRCIPPEWLVDFHTGYDLDQNDYHDIKLLCEKFDIPLPIEYQEFVFIDQSK